MEEILAKVLAVLSEHGDEFFTPADLSIILKLSIEKIEDVLGALQGKGKVESDGAGGYRYAATEESEHSTLLGIVDPDADGVKKLSDELTALRERYAELKEELEGSKKENRKAIQKLREKRSDVVEDIQRLRGQTAWCINQVEDLNRRFKGMDAYLYKVEDTLRLFWIIFFIVFVFYAILASKVLTG